MLAKLRGKLRGYFRRREVEAEWRGFIAGMQYGKYLAKNERQQLDN